MGCLAFLYQLVSLLLCVHFLALLPARDQLPEWEFSRLKGETSSPWTQITEGWTLFDNSNWSPGKEREENQGPSDFSVGIDQYSFFKKLAKKKKKKTNNPSWFIFLKQYIYLAVLCLKLPHAGSLLPHVGCLVVSCKLLLEACGMSFPHQGSNSGLLHWECGVSATGPSGKSCSSLIF